MRVRPSRPQDRDFVLGLAGRFAEYPLPAWRDPQSVVAGTVRQLTEAFASQDERSAILIAENERGPQGFVWVLMMTDFYTARDVGKISEVAVAADGLGAGSALLAAAEAWVRERGASVMALNVMEENHRARRFYERHGYAPEHMTYGKRLDDD